MEQNYTLVCWNCGKTFDFQNLATTKREWDMVELVECPSCGAQNGKPPVPAWDWAEAAKRLRAVIREEQARAGASEKARLIQILRQIVGEIEGG